MNPDLPWQEDLSPLFEPSELAGRRLVNRLAVHPMEGFDGEPDGSPGPLTRRRYDRFARGGSAMIWFEATSLFQEGRSNPHQLMLTKNNLDAFKKLVETTRRSAFTVLNDQPFLVLQLTHSGRYSRPLGKPEPLIACVNPHLDAEDSTPRVVTDDELERIRDRFVESFRLARDAGFDAVDIKACHGYLIHDLLSAHTRLHSRYGGGFENRCRLLLEIIEQGRCLVPELAAAVRLSVTDAVPMPYGFGVRGEEKPETDLTEPETLIEHLLIAGCSLLNVTAGNPHHQPHQGRPYNRGTGGGSSPEPPAQGVVRLLELASRIQKRFPNLPVTGTGYSWLGSRFPEVAAGVLSEKQASIIGLGRSSFAYPDALLHLARDGTLDPGKVCIACSRCTELMRAGGPAGCAVRDELYKNLYKEKTRSA
ncbi:MAG TPA: hypothetical protein ENN03_01730 [bacterium]|nr:hypothetical protein [bacterium]